MPSIDPTTYDLIIIGTGLPESITAAAASTSGKTVLHLDPNPYYGSHYSTLSPPDLLSHLFTQSHSLETFSAPHFNILDHTKTLSLDVSGPRVLFCADKAVDLLLKSGLNAYLEFKSVEGSFIYDSEGKELVSVPDSRSTIVRDRKCLTLPEKNLLMRFFKLVQSYFEKGEGERGEVISDEYLEKPFVEFLEQMRLSKKIRGIILYAIALADYDQEDTGVSESGNLVRTKDGIHQLALYHSSLARFPNAEGAMLYPMYGQGELPQAFCRRAAVKGCLHVLRMPVTSLVTEKGSGHYKGVRVASGQELFSTRLIVDPQLVVSQGLDLSGLGTTKDSHDMTPRDIKPKVARAICIASQSLKSEMSNLFLVFPPRSLYPLQATAVRALQLSGGVAVCPKDMYVLHLSALCNDASQGKQQLSAAIDALYRRELPGSCGTSSSERPEDTSLTLSQDKDLQKPTLLWSILYIQEITEGSSVETISTFPSPDGHLSYHSIVGVAEKMYQQVYPGEELFPKQAASEEPEDSDGGSSD